MWSIQKGYVAAWRAWKAVRLYLIVSGPGIVVMIANNDAGSITTYALTGARYGYHLIWLLLLLIPAAYYIQEMTVRLGAVTKRGHAEAIFEGFGSFWGWLSLLDLFLLDRLTVVTEFAGMVAALRVFAVPAWFTVVGVCVLMGGIAFFGRYWTWEKIALLFCGLNLIYIPAAVMLHPSIADIAGQGLLPNFPGGFGGQLLFFLLANIGTTISPWMLFFQQSSVVDKGLQEKDIPWGKLDTLIGSAVTVAGAVFIMVLTGTALLGTDIDSAAQAARFLMPSHPVAGALLAIGLFNAGLLGALCVSLTSSWAFGEIFGWAHSLNHRVREAPWFYVTYSLTLVSAGLVVLIPGAPLAFITLSVQVAEVILLPAALAFLVLLLNDRKTMGDHANSAAQNLIGGGLIVVLVVLSTLYGAAILFPQLLD